MVNLCPYQDSDWGALAELIEAADAVDRREWGLSISELQENLASPHFSPGKDMILAWGEGRNLAGLGRILRDAGDQETVLRTGGVVHPNWRRQGIGRQIMEWLLDRAWEQRDEMHADTVCLGASCETSDVGRTALFMGLGMRPARYFLKMARPLQSTALPAPCPPTDIVLREFRRGQDDEMAWAASDEAFRDHWGYTGEALEDWVRWANLPRIRPDLSTLAWHGDHVIGLCMCEINERENAHQSAREARVDTLGVRRAYRHRGIGQALLLASLHRLREAGIETVTVGVDSASPTGASLLYERVGFKEQKRFTSYRMKLEPRR